MHDGLYQVAFKTLIGSGHGVITATNGKLSGGDSRSYYLGHYTLKGTFISMELRIARYRPLPFIRSVLGSRTATVQLTGEFDGKNAELSGFAISRRLEPLSVSVKRIDDGDEKRP